MENITINDEGLMEVVPTTSRDQQLGFIDTYRQLQGENTAQIGDAAHALGSDLTAQYGGLHGPSEYIKSRYQTPQTESRIAGLRSATQLSALNQLMQNETNKWKNRYSNAKRNYEKSAYDANKAGSNLGNVRGEAEEEYSGLGGDTIGVSSNEDKYLQDGENIITVTSDNGAFYNGRPRVHVTTGNTNDPNSSRDAAYYGPNGEGNGYDSIWSAIQDNLTGTKGASTYNTINNIRGVVNPITRPLTAVNLLNQAINNWQRGL